MRTKKSKTPPEGPKVGDTVELIRGHVWSGHRGEIVGFDVVLGKRRPKVRLYDVQDHEVYVMNEHHMRVLR